MASIENIAAALEKAIKETGVNLKEVATLSLVFDLRSEKMGIVQTGGLMNPMGPVAALFNSEVGEDVFKAVYAMLTDKTRRMMLRMLKPIHGGNACVTCKRFNEKSSHFGNCEHHRGFFDGEEANSKVTQTKDGCPFYEQGDTEEARRGDEGV